MNTPQLITDSPFRIVFYDFPYTGGANGVSADPPDVPLEHPDGRWRFVSALCWQPACVPAPGRMKKRNAAPASAPLLAVIWELI